MQRELTVFVVDDDAAVRESIRRLVNSKGVPAETYASSEEFLQRFDPAHAGCLIADARLPGVNGLELLETLRSAGVELSVIVTARRADVSSAVRAMLAGAITFLEKPCADFELWDSIEKALRRQRRRQHRSQLRRRVRRLKSYQQRVLKLILEGASDQQLAEYTGTDPETAARLRAKIMKTASVRSLAELIQLAAEIGGILEDSPPPPRTE